MDAKILIRGFPAELARAEPPKSLMDRAHIVRDGLAARAGTGFSTPPSERSSASQTPAISRVPSRDACLVYESSPPASLLSASPKSSRGLFNKLINAAGTTVSALLAPSQTSVTRLRPPPGCCR